MLDDCRRDENLAASLARESRDRHAPHTLAGEAPVRPVLDHAVDAVAAARREPSYYVDLLKCFRSEIVLFHRDEPLIGGAEDHGILAPPAMRVSVRKGPLSEQDARRLELLHDQRVCLEDGLPLPFRGFVREPTLIVHRRQDFQRRLDLGLIARVVVLERQLVVFLAVPRRDVHAPCPLLQGDEFAEQDRRSALRRRAAAAQALEPAQLHLPLPDSQNVVPGKAAGLGDRIHQLFRDHQHRVPDPHKRIVEVRMQAHSLVGGQRPRRGRPNHDRDGLDVGWKVDAQDRAAGQDLGRVLQRKLDVDRRRGVLLVLDFGLRQGRLIDGAPEDRLLPLVHPATLYELADLAQDRGLVIVGHGQVRVVPVAQHAQALELLPLDLEVLLGVLAAELADLGLAERLLLGAQLLQDLMLDRQPVAVPAGDERHLVVLHRLGLDDDILENLVQRVADVDAAVGIRRTIVQHVERPAAPGLLDALIEVLALPASQDLRLALREIGLHGKVSLGEIQRGLVVHRKSSAHRSTAPHPNQQSLRPRQPHGGSRITSMIAYAMASGRLADILLPSTPTLGDPKASVLMIEFSDFTCGYCGRFYRETLPALKAEYLGAGKVRFAYRDYPRDPEGWGLVAAHAARCAGEQGQFWGMHDRLFDQHARLGTGVIMQLAKDLQLNEKTLAACMDSQKHVPAIMADRELATALGFRGTPGFLVVRTDGHRFSDPFTIPGAVRYDVFRAEIERLLKKR